MATGLQEVYEMLNTSVRVADWYGNDGRSKWTDNDAYNKGHSSMRASLRIAGQE